VALPDDQAQVWERALLGYVPREIARRMNADEWEPELSQVLMVPSRPDWESLAYMSDYNFGTDYSEGNRVGGIRVTVTPKVWHQHADTEGW
jgi:hypothetical protein